MLKIRLIGVVLVRNGTVVQSIGFRRYLPIGSPEIAVSYLDRWGVDEILILHIDGTPRRRCASTDEVRAYANQCRVPLSIGGGVASAADAVRMIQAGADKVVINSALFSNPSVVTRIADQLGTQCVVASIDGRRRHHGGFAVVSRQSTGSNVTPAELARRAEELGAGEILITSVDRDGTRSGYDLELTRSVLDVVGLPVIACGGAGHGEHLRAAMALNVSATAVANMLHFTEHSAIVLKRYLEMHHAPVRLDSYVTYQEHELAGSGRLRKQSDEVLEALRFVYIPEEVI